MSLKKQLLSITKQHQTPFYCYDMSLLSETIQAVKLAADKHNFHVHYALKANPNQTIVDTISKHGLGADCVSGGEVALALKSGIPNEKIVLAGVGKTDDEILLAIEQNIFSINVESINELEVINELARSVNKTARIAIRLNPNVDAQTMENITTGRKENKFGIAISDLPAAIQLLESAQNLNLTGIHFHIGSQILDLQPFKNLCNIVNATVAMLESAGIQLEHVNLGGGLGINYFNPDIEPIPNFDMYFSTISDHLKVDLDVHFELGRSIVAQCGSLVTQALYTKQAGDIRYIIVDAGMSELMRPALYKAHHKIEKLDQSEGPLVAYSVAGPVCETTDCFGENVSLTETRRGDILLLRSCGAYGESMSNNYNLRKLNEPIFLTSEVAY